VADGPRAQAFHRPRRHRWCQHRQLHTATLRIAGAQSAPTSSAGRRHSARPSRRRTPGECRRGPLTTRVCRLQLSQWPGSPPTPSAGARGSSDLPPGARVQPVYLDSAAYHLVPGTAPPWASYTATARRLADPRDGAMVRRARRPDASHIAYERLRSDGRDLVILARRRPAWDTHQMPRQGRLAARDPILRSYADRVPMVAIGGLRRPRLRTERHRYLAALAHAFPDTLLGARPELGDQQRRPIWGC
jgi:hypothetical protein